MNKRKFWLTLLTAVLLIGLAFAGTFSSVAAQTDDTDDDTDNNTQTQTETQTQSQSLMAVIRNHDQLNDFETLVQAAGLADNLNNDGPFTVFAPTDEALANLETVAANADVSVTDILLYHIVNGNYNGSAVANRSTLPTLMGDQVNINVEAGSIVLNDTSGFTTTDIQASNGTLHIIDTVLLPPVNSIFTSNQGSREDTLNTVLADDGRFTTFLSLLQMTDLNIDLDNPAQSYTIFAPTDAAFEKLSDELMDQLMNDAQTREAILSYHIVGDSLSINQIANDHFIPTLEGRPVIVSTDASQNVSLNGTPVATFNIVAANGVVHAVNTVLTP
ncbi:MAG: fasciclin domain-containing protein [Anaerolineaceae bacterium]|nr:fasciclin domain-containing protein [Anaerolineaceae bacterium]